MNPIDIIRIAQVAGFGIGPTTESIYAETPCDKQLQRFAALVAEQEREACAKVAQETLCDTHLPTGVKIYGGRAAAAIRARVEK